jgi:hypothetical protein
MFWVAFSQSNVARSLGAENNAGYKVPIPPGIYGACNLSDIPVHRLVPRAFQLPKALPDGPLHVFEKKKVASLPRTTEAEQLVV